MEISDKKIEWPCRPAKTPRRRTAARAAQAQKPPHRPPSRRTSAKPSGGRGVTGARPARFKNHSWCWLCRHSDQKCSEPDSFLRFLCEIELSLQSRAHFVDLILQKCCGPSVFTILCDQPLGGWWWWMMMMMMMMMWLTYEIELWLQSHAHFANLIFQKWSKHDIFLFFMWNRALAAVLRAFCRPHLPKASRPLSSFTVTFFNWKSSSRYSSVHCLLTTFPDRSANHARKQRPLIRRPRQPLYPKKHRVSRPREFSSLNSLVPDLLDFPTTWWWCICHDDVVDRMIDMMMWLPQWWESWPWQSSVTRKFPN